MFFWPAPCPEEIRKKQFIFLFFCVARTKNSKKPRGQRSWPKTRAQTKRCCIILVGNWDTDSWSAAEKNPQFQEGNRTAIMAQKSVFAQDTRARHTQCFYWGLLKKFLCFCCFASRCYSVFPGTAILNPLYFAASSNVSDEDSVARQKRRAVGFHVFGRKLFFRRFHGAPRFPRFWTRIFSAKLIQKHRFSCFSMP